MTAKRRRPVPFRTLGDLEGAARRAVDDEVWDYIQGGSGAERTARANEAAFARWALLPEVLRDVRSVDLRTSLLGQVVSAPFFLAPTAYHRQVHPEGERATAAAAAGLGVLGVYSTLSSDSLEAIAATAGRGPRWFQLYPQADPDVSLGLARRAERARYSALVVTVDAPLLGSRDRQGRTGFALERAVPIGNGSNVRTPPRGPTWEGGTYGLAGAGALSWQTLGEIRRATSLPLVVKGVLTAKDALRAIEAGAKAVIVSNHGGRQLDLAAASLDVLPPIVQAVRGKAEVYLDGGVRRGSDIVVALALGARAVGVGRPALWALAAGGRAGVDRFLRMLGTELANSLVLVGRSSVRDVDRSLVVPAGAERDPPRRSGGAPRGESSNPGAAVRASPGSGGGR